MLCLGGLAPRHFGYRRLEAAYGVVGPGRDHGCVVGGGAGHKGQHRSDSILRKTMIQSVESLIRYFDSIRRRTLTFARAVPADRIDWSPQEDAFTFGDILRHIAAVEEITVHAVKD